MRRPKSSLGIARRNRTIGLSAKHVNQMPGPAVPLVLSRITIATTCHHFPAELTEEQVGCATQLLWKYKNRLSVDDFDLGYTNVLSHSIDTGSHAPIRESLRRHPITYMELTDNHVDQTLQKNVIEPAMNEWASNIALVGKKGGSMHFVVDYIKLNQISRKGSCPLPHIDVS